MAETNQLLLNYYKKEEIKKIQQLSKEKASLKTILGVVDLDYITKEEVLEMENGKWWKMVENGTVRFSIHTTRGVLFRAKIEGKY